MFLWVNGYCFWMKATDFLDSNAFCILEALLGGPFYLRELAEKTGFAPSTVHKILMHFRQNRMVRVENAKNRKVFSLDPDSALASLAVSFWMADKILHSRAFAKLVQLKPSGIFLFGSAHSGKITLNSDIDLAVFFEKKPDSFKLSAIKSALGNELLREIDLIVLTKEKIKSMKEEKSELLNRIANQSTVLWGETIDLG